LFDYTAPKPATAPPPGFRCQTGFVSEAEEKELAAAVGTLPLKPFRISTVMLETVVRLPLVSDMITPAVKSGQPRSHQRFWMTFARRSRNTPETPLGF
jgi:hypothetical protein